MSSHPLRILWHVRDDWTGSTKVSGEAARAAMKQLREIVDNAIEDRRGKWAGHVAALDIGVWKELAEQVDAEMRAAVDRARAAGATWKDIADVFGVSRASAQQRFGRK